VARSVPVSLTETPGLPITSAWQNAQVKALTDFITGPPVFVGYQSSAQSTTSGTWTSLTIDTEVIDTDSGHSTAVNPSRYTATVPGLYLVVGSAAFIANATGYRRCRITKNGSLVRGGASGYDVNTANIAGGVAIVFVTMNGTTDYVEVMGAQASGSTINTSTATDLGCTLSLYWIST
jgi:hypothetical protein